jgi:hypothetical protein
MSLIIREMQITATVRCHSLIPTEMALSQKRKSRVGEDVEN